MKTKTEITERLVMYQEELKRHNKNPIDYEESFTELVERAVALLEWVLRDDKE